MYRLRVSPKEVTDRVVDQMSNDECREALKEAFLSVIGLYDEIDRLNEKLAWQPVTSEWPPDGYYLPVRLRDGRKQYGFRHNGLWHLIGGKYTADAVSHGYELPPL
jgi:hypothetical protein